MPNTGQFTVTIPNIEQLKAAMAAYPTIATPLVQQAIVKAQAILAQNTNANTVPQKTSFLLHNWGVEIGTLYARWWPQQTYAPYVEFGTPPHVIEPVNKMALANTATGWGPYKRVNHPGTKPNPFMERILAASQEAIVTLFSDAGDKITAAVAAQTANGK